MKGSPNAFVRAQRSTKERLKPLFARKKWTGPEKMLLEWWGWRWKKLARALVW